MSLNPHTKRKIFGCLAGILVLAVAGGWFGWYKFFREEPEPIWADETEHFKYGSIGAEATRGIPYYIWLVLPRTFPEYVPGPGGYKAFGLVWEEGHEMPVGFTKKIIGFSRVGNNCALCHTGTWRSKEDETPHLVAAAPSHTTDVQGLLRFLTKCGQDPRFNASTLLAEIDREVKLSTIDRLIYRFALVPLTRSALQQQQKQLAWMNRPGWPDWGRGRDDPMNLTKYFMTSMATDNSTGQADFPSVWNLKVRKGDGLYLNWSCDTPAVRSVLIDSALGLGSAPDPNLPFDEWNWSHKRRDWFLKRMENLDNFLSELPPPKYPFAVDAMLAAQGKPIYAQQCASCHDVGGRYTNKPVPPAEIATDRERLDTWIKAAADEANRRVKAMGINRPNMVKIEGYQSPPLDGIWMRAPYLHNGSVPTLRDLLKPAGDRPKLFYRGYDIYDSVNVGFVTTGFDTKRYGWKHDTTERGNGNQGHNYGITLAADEKNALIEYLKTF
jgi:mono/diheme cytochrome c family protein